jgi:endonuclease YncB( thermonuclease family)
MTALISASWLAITSSLSIVFSLVMLPSSLGFALPAQAADFKGKVVTVIDGDTMMILNGQTPVKVVLYAIDCPELGQDAGPIAKQFTSARCLKKVVTVKECGQDKLGRVIAELTLEDGTNLNKELVTSGLAWWTKKFAQAATDYRDLERAARTDKKGLWVAADPMPPWIFRNGRRTREVHATIKAK